MMLYLAEQKLNQTKDQQAPKLFKVRWQLKAKSLTPVLILSQLANSNTRIWLYDQRVQVLMDPRQSLKAVGKARDDLIAKMGTKTPLGDYIRVRCNVLHELTTES